MSWEEGGAPLSFFDLRWEERTIEWTLSAPFLGTVPHHLPTNQPERGCSGVEGQSHVASRRLEHEPVY